MEQARESVRIRLTKLAFLPYGIGVCVCIAAFLAFSGAVFVSHAYKNRVAITTMIIDLREANSTAINSPNYTGNNVESSQTSPDPITDPWRVARKRITLADGISAFDHRAHHFMPIDGYFKMVRLLNTIEVLLSNDPPPLIVYSDEQSSKHAILIDQGALQHQLRTLFLRSFAIQCMVLIIAGLFIMRLARLYLIKPLDDLVDTLNDFSADPSIALPTPISIHNQPEYRDAALALDRLQRNTLLALRQRERLADIGEAVAKINHDIRNALSSATLVADTMLASNDPKIQRTAPYVAKSLEQAVDLCQSMLDYLVEPPAPQPEKMAVWPLISELEERLGTKIIYDGPTHIFIDSAMITRILTNLIRNATIAGAGTIGIDIWKAGRLAVIDIADDGPGIPENAWNDLFLAFRTNRRNGTGLGLAISRDLAVALGGNIKLARSGSSGSEFRLQLPEQIFYTSDARIGPISSADR